MSKQLATMNGRDYALEQLKHRRENNPVQINNAELYAGSPMYFYCYTCGWLSDTLPEGYISRPSHICDECNALRECGWLE